MTALPPEMKPCREEMRDLPCFGLPGHYGLAGGTECGRTVELACPSCGVHRCRTCAVHGVLCPVCPVTNPETYPLPEVH